MTKKGLLMLVLAVFIAGGVFAQDFASMPKNTVTVDVGPTILGLGFGQVGKIAGNFSFLQDASNINSTGLGIAAQFERQVLTPLSVALRGAYMGVGLDMRYTTRQDGATLNATPDLDLKAISAEAQVRFYPFAGAFFVGGLLGYGNLKMDLSGSITGTYMGQNINLSSLPTLGTRNYAKVGARVGWRLDFGNPGGFVFEPSLGYDHAIGLGGDTFGERFKAGIDASVRNSDQITNIGKILDIVESYVFAGGPRLTLGFGWRF